MAIDAKIWNPYGNWETIAELEDPALLKKKITGNKLGWWRENGAPEGFENALAEMHRDLARRRRGRGIPWDFSTASWTFFAMQPPEGSMWLM